MGTDEVIRKTLALAQSQLSNYKVIDSHRAISSATQRSRSHNTSQAAKTDSPQPTKLNK